MTIGFAIASIIVLVLVIAFMLCARGAWVAFTHKGWHRDAILGWMLIGAAALCMAGILFTIAVYRQETGETFELLKSEWVCTASHDETGVIPMKVGDVTVMMPTETTVCDTYSRKH